MDNTETTTTAEMQTLPPEIERPSEAVVRAVADAEGVEPTDLDPLYDVVDPDSLDSLFQPLPNRPDARTSLGEVRFSYEGHDVRVTSTGRVTLDD